MLFYIIATAYFICNVPVQQTSSIKFQDVTTDELA